MVAFKLQAACLIITLYVLISYYGKQYNKECKAKHTKIFEIILAAGIIYFFLDMATVYTVNHLNTVNPVLNRVLHLFFLLSIDIIMFLVFKYLLALCEFEFAEKWEKFLLDTPFVLSLVVATVNIGNLEYLIGKETNYSMGMSAYVCYAAGFIYFLMGIIVFFKRWNYIEKKKATVITECLIVVIGTLVVQMIFPETLISSFAVVVVILGFYIHIENFSMMELEEIHESTIHSFADIVESRDESTGEHIKRTTVYVKIIAEELRNSQYCKDILTKDYIDSLIQAAPMHDIGKIAVPDYILQKPGKLTAEEFEQIKSHTVKGAELIQKSFCNQIDNMYIAMAYEVALYHHEKWNGGGYPQGLEGNHIPLSARIMAVADVFDAVSQNRCYRSAMSLDEAFSIISNGIGKDFDPIIAQAFINARAKVEQSYRQIVQAV